MPRWIDDDQWKGIDPAVPEYPVKWENYPETWQARSLPGIHVPDRWGHFRRGHKIGRVMFCWDRIERNYQHMILKQLDGLYPPDYSEQRKNSPAQNIAFCFYLHNYAGLITAVNTLIDEAVSEALAPYQPKPKTHGRPRRKRKYTRRDTPLSLAVLYKEWR